MMLVVLKINDTLIIRQRLYFSIYINSPSVLEIVDKYTLFISFVVIIKKKTSKIYLHRSYKI